ncbi:hypothetical protein GCM10028807_58200 [Spirosoma daeguense]
MDVKEFLLTNKKINQAEIARLMWPKNSGAKSYLASKLHNSNGRSFTKKDAIRAKEVLDGLGVDLSAITVADSYE